MTGFLADYGLVVLFLVIALQAAGVGGLPGKTALVAAAILAADGHFAIVEVIAVAAFAVILGGLAGYLIGRKAGRPLLEHPRVARRFARPLALAEAFFDRHGPKAVFLARFLPGLKVVAAPLAGISRMRLATFAVWHTLAAVGFAAGFGLGAYWAGEATIELVERYGLVALGPVAALALAAWLAFPAVRRRAGLSLDREPQPERVAQR